MTNTILVTLLWLRIRTPRVEKRNIKGLASKACLLVNRLLCASKYHSRKPGRVLHRVRELCHRLDGMLVSPLCWPPTRWKRRHVGSWSNGACGACRTRTKLDRCIVGTVGEAELDSFWNGDVQHDVTISLRKKTCWLPGRWVVKDPLSMKWLRALLQLSGGGRIWTRWRWRASRPSCAPWGFRQLGHRN
jgi:hypothetical protein